MTYYPSNYYPRGFDQPLHDAHVRRFILAANRIARRAGYTRATEISRGDDNVVVSHTACGHRKNTTGEYVPKAYLRNFGWKNTFYQEAECRVQVKS